MGAIKFHKLAPIGLQIHSTSAAVNFLLKSCIHVAQVQALIVMGMFKAWRNILQSCTRHYLMLLIIKLGLLNTKSGCGFQGIIL